MRSCCTIYMVVFDLYGSDKLEQLQESEVFGIGCVVMDLFLNDLFHLDTEEISNSKIELNMKAGKGGVSFLDRWLEHTEEEKKSGKCKDCSYWSNYGNKGRNFKPGQVVFSFVRFSEDTWLFVSAGTVIRTKKDDWADVEILDKYSAYFGRLIVSLKKGNTYAQYTFNLGKFIDQIKVKEVLPCLYSGSDFNGYDNVSLPYHKLEYVFSGKIYPTYYEALKKVTGVYCLTDTKTGMLYIGSATGEEGVAQRWGNYLDSSHGGNKKLIALYKSKGKEYFEQNFTYTLIEYFGLSYDPERIKQREQYWKRCFDSIKHGYNDN